MIYELDSRYRINSSSTSFDLEKCTKTQKGEIKWTGIKFFGTFNLALKRYIQLNIGTKEGVKTAKELLDFLTKIDKKIDKIAIAKDTQMAFIKLED